ncbi:helix-turn-helix domain-containing protein [Paraclostridium sordellii]|uniref:helix-turn-helix domain-containing protein n=1 Tax=Paraclostridium sordellii TaxID=1505 RepID=UPI0005DC605F|nr:cupin domain-containing protein [Paeniclostridium sordellii]CEQ17072.1 transcriptional regulator [[Clostridium] sordellii] [Paeniclostridium sordellii]CEQ26918.1 transcriptional regulator [[Clostridium] sordellii] [Paeniclostridium sordellii]
MNEHIGAKIKHLRTQRKMTLKDLSEKTNLSIGFLSQLERGLTSIATDTLGNIADVFEVELSYFFLKPRTKKKPIIRSYEKEVFNICTSGCIQYNLSNNLKEKIMLPRLVDILPNNTEEDIQSYMHDGEEFLYVLEGTLTLFLDGEEHELYPGDSIHYNSSHNHNWANYTNKMVRILVVATPNPFNDN